jgi:Bacterial type II/III secretion system short domain
MLNRLRFILLCALLAAGAAFADEVEVIPVRHRTAEQIIPAVRPLVSPGGAVTGTQSSLVVRSTRANIEDIKRVVAALDRAPRQLLISVRQDAGDTASREAISAAGTLSGGRGSVSVGQGAPAESRINARILDSSRSADDHVVQQVQALEGSPAYISLGSVRPLPTRSTTLGPGGVVASRGIVYQEASTGFTVVPRVSGDRVTLEINSRQGSLERRPRGSARTSDILTAASGVLGEWIELGGTSQSAMHEERGIFSREAATHQTTGRVWVSVDEIR